MKNQIEEDKLDAFFQKEGPFQSALLRLREIMLSHDLMEHYKWQMPVYSLEGKNLIGMSAFKQHFGVWFMQGALLSDKRGKLINAQVGKTVAMRQWRFTHEDEIDEALMHEYVNETIENQKAGLEIARKKPISKKLKISGFLKKACEEDANLLKAFERLTPGRQREYLEYLKEAKRETTKISRLQKITPMILSGKGLNDKYK